MIAAKQRCTLRDVECLAAARQVTGLRRAIQLTDSLLVMPSLPARWLARLISTIAVAARFTQIVIVMDHQRGSQLTQQMKFATSAAIWNR